MEGVPRPVITASTDTVIVAVGTAISDVTIDSSVGGTVTSYVIMPNLNADTGLDFDTVTGTIFGTPTKAQTETIYAITSINTTGMDTVTLTITDGSGAEIAVVNTLKVGIYNITYTVTDVAGNVADAVTRVVTITRPAFDLNVDGLYGITVADGIIIGAVLDNASKVLLWIV